MEITINLDTLTPAQAFQIGFQLRERPEYHEAPVIAATLEPMQHQPIKPRTPRRSHRFRFNTSASLDVIQLMVYLRQSGFTLQQVADKLNERQIPSISGKPWSEQMAWAVMYSKQAKPLWKDA
jgi:hypothetical protein